MSDVTQTFSESWYRIAGQRLSLRPGINVRRQNFRGQRWIVIEAQKMASMMSPYFSRMTPRRTFLVRVSSPSSASPRWSSTTRMA